MEIIREGDVETDYDFCLELNRLKYISIDFNWTFSLEALRTQSRLEDFQVSERGSWTCIYIVDSLRLILYLINSSYLITGGYSRYSCALSEGNFLDSFGKSCKESWYQCWVIYLDICIEIHFVYLTCIWNIFKFEYLYIEKHRKCTWIDFWIHF